MVTCEAHELMDKNGAVLLRMEEHVFYHAKKMKLHSHHELELSAVLKGSALYHIDDRVYDLKQGDIILLNNTEMHGLELTKDEEFCHCVIHFDPSFIWNSLSNDLDYNFLLVFFERGSHFSNRLDRDNPATARIFRLIQEMRQEFLSQRICYELLIKIKLQTIFAEIIRNYDYIDRNKAGKPLPEEDIQRLNITISYINAHLSGELRLNELAALMHVSPAYFSTLFKKFNGVSPVEYIVHKRVQRAVEMIRTTSLNMTEVAMACGFNNGTNFYKAFHKVTGRTPASYRRLEDFAQSKDSLTNSEG